MRSGFQDAIIGQKNILPAIYPEDNMIESAGKVDAWFACYVREHVFVASTYKFGSLTLFSDPIFDPIFCDPIF